MQVYERNLKPGGGSIKDTWVKVPFWGCDCCAYANPLNPESVGWTAELEQNGQIIATAKSSPELEKGVPVKSIMRFAGPG